MASRKEQKEQLRREREERESKEREAAKRKRMVGIGAGGLAALVVVIVAGALLLGGGGGGGGEATASDDVLPSGGTVPARKTEDLNAAVKAAGCRLRSYKGKSREHLADPNQKVKYDSDPPTEGRHYQVPADDGAYSEAVPQTHLVHALEHGRIIIWYKTKSPKSERAGIKALFDKDSYQMILAPDDTMPGPLAVSAWSKDPAPLGTGHLMSCPRMTNSTYDAIQSFRDRYRGNGPEVVP